MFLSLPFLGRFAKPRKPFPRPFIGHFLSLRSEAAIHDDIERVGGLIYFDFLFRACESDQADENEASNFVAR